MKRAIDSERGRALYGGRFATVEPVFGNIRHNKGLDRFTLRGQRNVNGVGFPYKSGGGELGARRSDPVVNLVFDCQA